MRTALGITVLLMIAFLTIKARYLFRKGAHRHMQARYQRAEGRRLTREGLMIQTSASPDAIQDAIVYGLALPYEKPVAMHAELFQGPIRSGYVQFGSGTKTTTVFTAGMRITSTDTGGCTVAYRVEKWTLADGIVAGIPQMKFLRRRIEEEARKADPRIEVSGEPGSERVP